MKIIDITKTDIISSSYDIAFFASGYEQRCIAVHQHLENFNVDKTLVIHFKTHKDKGKRIKNDRYYKKYKYSHMDLGFDEQDGIYKFLNQYYDKNPNENYKFLIDYSSMSRLWYAAILNWGYFHNSNIEIDLIYNIGKYKEGTSPLTINQILSIPSCEGDTSHNKTISIFGLGFDKISTLFVLDRIEPDIVYSLVADSPINRKYLKKCRTINEEFLKNYSKPEIIYPLESVWKIYHYLQELIIPFENKYNISLIPMGPKPNVLASILLSISNRKIICLYVKGDRRDPVDVIPSDTFIYTKVYL